MLVQLSVESGVIYAAGKEYKANENIEISSAKPIQLATKTQEAEIRFQDDSLLRFAPNTSVRFSAEANKITNGKTIAQVTYENGFLW